MAIFATLLLPLWDDQSIDDADIIISSVMPLSDDKNILALLPNKQTVTQKQYGLLQDIPVKTDGIYVHDGIALTDQQLKNYITDTQDIVTTFESSLKRDKLQCAKNLPVDALGHVEEMCELGFIRTLTALVLLHAQYSLDEGQPERAKKLTLLTLKLGHALVDQRQAISMIEHLLGRAVMDLSITMLGTINEIQPVGWNDLDVYQISAGSLRRAFEGEYLFNKSLILKTIDPGLRTPFYFASPNKTVNSLAEFNRAEMAVVMTPCTDEIDMSPFAKTMAENKNVMSFNSFFRPNFVGRLSLSVLVTPLATKMRQSVCETNQKLRG